MSHIMFCKECEIFTLKEKCPKCENKTILPQPPKYSPDDHYAEYRRKAKEEELKNKGYL